MQFSTRFKIAIASVLAVASTWTLSGQTGTNPDPGEDSKKLERGKLSAMSQEERRAHRAERKAELRARGIEQGPAGYQPLSEPQPVAKRAVRVPGTSIQYDSGVVTGFVTLSTSDLVAVNRFDSAVNAFGTAIEPVQASGSLTMITFNMIETSGATVTWYLFDSVMGTSAMMVTDPIIPAAVGLNTFTVGNGTTMNNTYMGSSFLAGLLQFNVLFTQVGADTNSNAGQGFHAYSINEPQTAAPNTGMGLATVGNVNFVFRVGGNVAAPVELLSFEIEE